MDTQPTLKPRMATILMQDAENALQDANVPPGSTLMASKKESGKVNVGQGQEVVTNVYRLDTINGKGKILYRYEVMVYGIRTTELFSDLTMRSRSDYRTTNNRNSCGAVLKAFKAQHSGFLLNCCLFYDQARVLYSTFDLLLPPTGIEEIYTLEQIRVHSPYLGDDVFNSYKLKIVQISDAKKVPIIGDFSHVSNDIGDIDRTLEQFLDIVTAQNVFDDPVNYTNFSASSYYLLNPAHFGFKKNDCPYFPSNSAFLGMGLHKGIRTVERPTNESEMSLAIVASVKKSPFHFVEFVSLKLKALLGTNFDFRNKDTEWVKERMEGFVKGIFAMTVHTNPDKRRFFEIHGLSSTNLHTEFIQREGNTKISLFDYYTQTYGIAFKYPELPLLIQKCPTSAKNNGVRYYPMEVCVILDNQRVKGCQQDGSMIRDMIRKSAILPSELKKHNTYLKDSLLLDGSEYLAGLDIKCNKDPIEVSARVLPPPELKFGVNSKQIPKLPRCAWSDGGQYYVSATCGKWVALALSGQQQDYLSADEWIEFVKHFRASLLKKRMKFSEPLVEHRQLSGSDLKLIIGGYYEQGYEYMLIAHPDNADQIHHAMKAVEQKTEVITQGVKLTTVKNVMAKHQFQTLENIIHKTNVKMGGLNYTVIVPSMPPQSDLHLIFGNDTLIVGIGTNHPMGGLGMQEAQQTGDNIQQGAQPTTSGTGSDKNGNSSNDKNGNSKNGNGGNGNNDTLPRGSVPSVVGFSANIGKNGPYEFVGDFVFQLAYRDEKVGIISSIIERCVKQFNVANGCYPIRLIIYRDGSGEGSFHKILKYEVPLIHKVLSDLGIAAKLTLIVVNKMQNVRLYAKNIDLRAKSPDQNILPGTVVDKDIGTAKTPRYNLLLDENNLSMDTLQAMTHSLCFGHQIVYSPTSLPTPVMVALEYAKRGRNIYNYASSSGSGGTFNGANSYDLNFINDRLTFKGSTFLRNMRVNA